MRKAILLVNFLFLFLAIPPAVQADCIKVGGFDGFALAGDDTVILYRGGAAVVKIETNCTVYEKSRIRLPKDYICDGDEIMIDDKTCNMVTVSSTNED